MTGRTQPIDGRQLGILAAGDHAILRDYLAPLVDSDLVSSIRLRRAALRITVFLSMACCAFALDPSQPLSTYLRTAFTVEDGLPSNVVNGIAQSGEGFLWIATRGGLVRFDGRHFLPIKLIPEVGETSAIVTGSDGDLWLGSVGGVIRVPRRYLDQTGPVPTTSYLPGIRIAVLYFAHDGVLWAGTSTGLFRLNGQEFLLTIPNVDISRIEETKDGHLFLTTARGVVEWNAIRATDHPELGRKYGGPKGEIYHVYQDRASAMWFCTKIGLSRVTGEKVDWFTTPGEDGQLLGAYRVFEEKSGSIWAVTSTGVRRLAGKSLEPLLPITGGRAIFEDRDGNMWFGTSAGLIRLRNRAVRIFTRADGLWNNVVTAVFTARDGTLWAGNNLSDGGMCGGLARFDGKRFHPYLETDGLLNTCVTSLAEDTTGNLWVATYNGGVFRFSNGKFTQYSTAQGLPSGAVLDVLAARDGSVWLATTGGLSRMRDGQFRNYTIDDGLSDRITLSIYQDRAGTIWAGAVHGLDRLEGERFVNAASLNDASYVRVAGEDTLGNLYLSCGGKGIARLAGGRLTALVPEIPGFEMTPIQQNLWFTGQLGFQRVNADQLMNWRPKRDGPLDYLTYGLADGLKSIEIGGGVPNITATPDGKVWVATRNGLAMVDTMNLPKAITKPATYIEQITVDRHRQTPGSELVLAPGSHRVEVDFDSIELSSPERTRIQYRLDGADSEWVDAETVRTALYPNVPLGRHQFHVRATNRDGVWDRNGIVYSITQEPHYYETNLFRVALVAAGLLLVFAVYQLRLIQTTAMLRARLEEKLAERERIARELHDTLLQRFQGSLIQMQAAHNLFPRRPEQAVQTLDEAITMAEGAIAESRDAIQDLRSPQVSQDDLANLLTVTGQDLARSSVTNQQASGILPIFRVSIEGERRDLDPLLQDETYRIARELLRNAFQHAQARHIEADIRYDKRQFRIRIRDDGKGIDPETLKAGGRAGHWGMLGITERAKRIGAQLHFQSGVGAGTEAELSVPSSVAYKETRGARRFPLFRRKANS